MINRVQVLWYLNKDDLENYCLDFKPYKSHKLDGYEICEVDEDLFLICVSEILINYNLLIILKIKLKLRIILTVNITNEEYELAVDSP